MECDIFILCDAAQVAGDKLQLIGGGWRFIQAAEFPVTHNCSLAVGLLVDWMETNRQHDFVVALVSEDTKQKLWEARGQFEQGRPPGYPVGAAQRVLIAFNLTVKFEHEGQHLITLTVDDAELATTSFLVKAQPKLQDVQKLGR